MANYLPENIKPFVKCHYAGTAVLGSIDIVVCTDNGYVVEFANYKIKRKCEIACCNAESVVPFVAYDPLREFYLIKAPNLLIVVIRGDKMKVLETYSSVQKYCIRDFSGKGFPMVGIWTKSSQSPDIITNFADKFEAGEREKKDNFSGLLIDKLQEICKVITELEMKLAEKKVLKEKCTRNLEETLSKKLRPEIQDGATSDERLSQVHIVKHWHRLHNEKWVIGASVMNRSNRKLFSINMLLSCDDEPNLCFCTRTIQYQKGTLWEIVESLPANSTGHIISILEVPNFKSSILEISTTIVCKIDSNPVKELQLHVPPYMLKVEDVARNLHSAFSLHEGVEDVLCVIAASEKLTLTAKWQRPELQLQNILIEKLHFAHHMNVGCFYNCGKETPGLTGIMIEILQRKGSDYIINLFTRNVQQLYLFVSMMYDVVPLDTVAFLLADKQRIDCDKLRDSFAEELHLVRGLLPEDAMVSDSDDVVVTGDKYHSFRKQFSVLELNTDILASGNC